MARSGSCSSIVPPSQGGEAFVARTVRLSQLFVAQTLAGGALALNGNPLSIPLNDPGFIQDPLAQWGVRATIRPTERLSVKLGAYDAEPAHRPAGDLEEADLSFTTQDGALLIAEIGLETRHGQQERRRRRQIKLGAYYDSSHFPLLSEPDRARAGQFGIYLLSQLEIFREGSPRAVGGTPTTRTRIRARSRSRIRSGRARD
jgi:hypothetical protein